MTKDFGQDRPLVLVVDGEREVLERTSAALAEAEFLCHCCETAEEAIAVAREDAPALIVCDLNLRGEGGIETCQQIKRHPGLEMVPVMFLSAIQRPDIIRRSLAIGESVYCLRKPFAPKVLVELIDQAIGVPEA